MRVCAWCKGPIGPGMRKDSIYCSVSHRQAAWRFSTDVVGQRDVARRSRRTEVLKLAYADPPYPGLSERYYSGHPDFAGEVDHADLIHRLSIEFDGWAVSTNASSLQALLPICPPDVKVAAWIRGPIRPGRTLAPVLSWEPVIYWHGRLDPDLSPLEHEDASAAAERDASAKYSGLRLDSLVAASRARRTDPAHVIGAKPATFCRWIFDLLGAQPQDDFTDVFPGSGGVQRAWSIYSRSSS